MYTKAPIKKNKITAKNVSKFTLYSMCNSKELVDKSSYDTEQDHMEMPKHSKPTALTCIYTKVHSNIHRTNPNIILNVCENNVDVLECVCA